MAIAKKGSRRIVVDGIEYRWRIRRKPSYSQALGWGPLAYTVELAATERGGTALVVQTDRAHSGNWLGIATSPVLPGDVVADIREALARGWEPSGTGSPFVLDRSAGFVKR